MGDRGTDGTTTIDATAALARPIDFDARYGEGLGSTLVLGGGGLFFVAWQVAYLEALRARGLDLTNTERLVGTSAGSLVAMIVAAGRLKRKAGQIDLLAKVPALISHLAGGEEIAPSQQRAIDLFTQATDAEPATIRAIGHAALAADGPPPQQIRRSLGAVLGVRHWPSPALHISAVDTYSGERLVITKESGIAVPAAAAASSAVPGAFTPQQLHDRRAMDGGVSGSGVHTDLVAGAACAFVLSLAANLDQSIAGMTSAPHAQQRELQALAATGTSVLVKGPAEVDETRLMDPTAVAGAIAMGEQQAAEDADEVLALWA